MFGGRGGGSSLLYGIIYLYMALLGFRGLNYLKLFKIIMGGIIYWRGAYQGKGDMSDGNVWGPLDSLWHNIPT